MSRRVNIIIGHLKAGGLQQVPSAHSPDNSISTFDVIVVGAGFAGLYASYKLSALGLRIRVFERGDSVGGTWFWNRYPGAKCDVESLMYAYTFSQTLQQEWSWSHKYGRQPQILQYLNHVADRFDLRRHIELSSSVLSCRWNDDREMWELVVNRDPSGERHTVHASFVVMATGCLSERNWPKVRGLSQFSGRLLHSQDWPREPVDFTSRRVGIIGTGSSGVQIITKIAPEAGHLFVFQRTPAYVLPANDGPIDHTREAKVKASFPEFADALRRTLQAADFNSSFIKWKKTSEADREAMKEARWQTGGFPYLMTFFDFFKEAPCQDISEFVQKKIQQIVHNLTVATALCPKYLIACKRACVADGYYETYNRSNVTLVDLQAFDGKIDEVTPQGVKVGNMEYLLDDLICATGFDAVTGALLATNIVGRHGISLRDEWRDGPRTYLGLACAGFPNLFTVTGPQSPSVLTNMPVAIEQHVEWIAACIKHVRDTGKKVIEATPDAQVDWVDHCTMVDSLDLSGWHPSCGNSWYSGANIEGKPRVPLPYRGGFGQPAGSTPWPSYADRCDAVAKNGYEGFCIT